MHMQKKAVSVHTITSRLTRIADAQLDFDFGSQGLATSEIDLEMFGLSTTATRGALYRKQAVLFNPRQRNKTPGLHVKHVSASSIRKGVVKRHAVQEPLADPKFACV